MTTIFALLILLQLAFLNIKVFAIPQGPWINYPVVPSTPPYPNTTITITTSYESGSPSLSTSYEMSYAYPSVVYTPQSFYPHTTSFSYSRHRYAVEDTTSQTTYPSIQYGTSDYYPTSTPSVSYTTTYPQPYSTSPVYYPPVCSSDAGIDVLNPGTFELWSYAPGICDLDNKPVSSSINYPFNGGPLSYYFVDNSITPPLSHGNKGDLWTMTCPSNRSASQGYLRPTHGTPQYFLLFGDPNSDPTPALTLHNNFSLVQGMGMEYGKAFLSYFGENWLACPGSQNPYTGFTQYSVYWNPGVTGECIQFRIEVRKAPRVCGCS